VGLMMKRCHYVEYLMCVNCLHHSLAACIDWTWVTMCRRLCHISH